ncbi:Putative amidase AmiD [bacterium HR36]|nr:Putative amidase AmiD [bacterium HR36]
MLAIQAQPPDRTRSGTDNMGNLLRPTALTNAEGRSATIVELAEQLRRREITAEELTRRCLAQIAAEDATLHAWVLVDEVGALEQARRCDQELTRGIDHGWLHGIPVGVKDIIDVAHWPTRAGVEHADAEPRQEDAFVVQRLRQAGAVLLGKTVTTPYAAFDPPPTRHPWLPGRTPGGSSSGSAVAVARGMCYAALATQTGGSITRPAAYCGVASFKPTFGRVSLRGVYPFAPHLDHVGGMARSVSDLALLFAVIAGYDPHDPWCVNLPVPSVEELRQGKSQPPRLGLIPGPWEERLETVMQEALQAACRAWQSRGAVIRTLEPPAAFGEVLSRHRTIMAVEAAAFHEEQLRARPQAYPRKITALLEEGLRTPGPEYVRCRQHQERLRWEMVKCFTEVDVLITPAAPGPPPPADTTGDPCCNAPWSYLGYPTISFPIASSPQNEPLAVQLVGRPFCEPALFSCAIWCEQALLA